jgi:hypothetical protein
MRESEFPAVTARWVADTVAMERPSVYRRPEPMHENRRDFFRIKGITG